MLLLFCRVFTNEQYLNNHLSVAHNIGPHKCPHCERRFHQLVSLIFHLQHKHADVCPIDPTAAFIDRLPESINTTPVRLTQARSFTFSFLCPFVWISAAVRTVRQLLLSATARSRTLTLTWPCSIRTKSRLNWCRNTSGSAPSVRREFNKKAAKISPPTNAATTLSNSERVTCATSWFMT